MRAGFCTVLLALCSSAYGWLPEYNMTAAYGFGDNFARPKLAFSPDGRLHCIHHSVEPGASQVRMYHRVWNGSTWSAPFDLPSPNVKEPESDMVVDSAGVLRVIGNWRWKDGADAYTVYYWNYNGTAWSGPHLVSSGTGDGGKDCLSLSMAIDSYDNLHVVWRQDGQSGGEADIMYRKRRASDGIWEPIQNVTNNPAGTSYGSEDPDIAVDRNGSTVHVVWHDDFLNDGFQAYYTKNTNLGAAGAWLPSSQWTRLSITSNYGKSPQIVLDHDNRPNVWYRGTFNGGPNTLAYTRWTGSAWTWPADWGSTRYFEAGRFDAANQLAYVYRDNASGAYEVYYRTYNYSAWSAPELVSAGANTSKCDYANVVFSVAGDPHVVWSERKTTASPTSSVYFSARAALGPPGPPLAAAATPGNTQVTVSWTNPPDVSYYATMVRFSASGFPAGPAEGTLLADKRGTIGASDSVVHSGLVNGQTYYYSLFAHDGQGGFSGPVPASTRPFGPGDFDRDGDVDQSDFGPFQACYSGAYQPQTDPACRFARLDADEDVDADDAGLFIGCVSGPQNYANPACVP